MNSRYVYRVIAFIFAFCSSVIFAQESKQFLEDANTYTIINPLYSQQLLNQSIEKRAQVISLYNSIFRILNPDIVNRIEA